ncbi:Tetratricopeptide repeat-containing protein [Belliella buryatensis]|uniref:Tetratricopeptide repeat-containing protein n=1 Tax=Belliella buryatensis TaxID=1500549 RepID=A0A239F9R4_9BACT|nr:tetratricopeptide repeat protein [Belliella buryatensis]SNS53545.1 Tetratricopeptide repeat-containing protein [Belliella buryatensis]
MIKVVYRIFFSLVVFINSFHVAVCSRSDSASYSVDLLDSAQVMELIEKSKKNTGSDYREAMSFAFQAKELAYQLNNSKLKLETELNLGKFFFYLGLYSEAIENTIEVIKIAEVNQDDLGFAKGYFQFGSLRLVMEDYAQAQEYIELARKYFLKYYGAEDKIDRLSRVTMHNNLGVIYAGLSDYQKAEEELRKGIALLEDSSELKTITIQLFNNLGDLYRKSDRIEEAISYYFEAKSKLEDDSNLLFDAMLDYSLGISYVELGAYDQAIEAFHQGLFKSKSVKGYSHIHHISKSLSSFHDQIGNKDSAFVYLSQSKMYEDSLNLKNTAEKLLKEELLAEFRVEKNQLQLLYQKNKKLLIASMIGLLLVAIGFYARAVLVKKNLDKVQSEKEKLAQEAEQNLEQTEVLKQRVESTQKELTLASMQALQKDEMLKSITKNLSKNDALKEDLDKILNSLKTGQTVNTLSEFELRFSGVYVGFFEKLMEEYPNLTHNDRRLSAFLKLQLTTKEISAITGQSIRAIEIGRTRLRGKLKLTKSDVNLYDFFVDY